MRIMLVNIMYGEAVVEAGEGEEASGRSNSSSSRRHQQKPLLLGRRHRRVFSLINPH